MARKAIRDYRKATGNLAGTAELLMTYVENGAEFTHEYGDIDERFYNSVESALEELAALLRGEAREMYPQFSDRLARVEQMTDGHRLGLRRFRRRCCMAIGGRTRRIVTGRRMNRFIPIIRLSSNRSVHRALLSHRYCPFSLDLDA